MRTMWDTTDIPPTGVPHDAQIVAGYINGLYRSFEQLVSWCPDAEHVSIAVTVHADADVLDIEQGDATPSQAPGWVDAQRARGLWQPTLYCERSQWGEVRAAVGNRNVAYWVADYTGKPHTLVGAVAVQYVNHGPNGENVDLSLVVDDHWPHRVAPKPQEEDMQFLVSAPGKPAVFLGSGASWVAVVDGDSLNAFSSAGAKSVTVSPAEYDHIASIAK